ncbi:MAG: cell division inhibitor [Flavobacteriales bacterium]|jgi:ligand-binding SRPBCC domain-containing protein|nr:MAG: cell division inhibitor [Flavobacteriales bacterium]|tara:strand:- start:887 stop:1345 length:459 start_codon:yes stop_codon:yes gene_type:complete
MYQYTSKQELAISMEQAWTFLSDPKNLKRITPDYMGFDIISGAERKMFPGQIIQYRLTPILGIPFRWVTEITHVQEGEFFVDEQRFGPYTFWHHKHFINKTENGVVMEDIVDYKLPLGPLGWLAHVLFVRAKVKQIFDYREKALNEIFNSTS